MDATQHSSWNDISLEPTRRAGLALLEGFLPHAGREYAAQRNYDRGPRDRVNVSRLSPYLSHRLVTEQEVVAAVVAHHGINASEKFVQEVCWRTYWKGWLEMRPAVWRRYRTDVTRLSGDAANSDAYRHAVGRTTGIACFDDWIGELIATGYLHNHARMWFASIWIHTLRLPWQLGADLFMRYLRDADAASNTLSWRWVAGLHTVGKTYLARPDNIAKYTDGAYRPPPGVLATDPVPLPPEETVSAAPLPPCPPFGETAASVLLVHEDDLAADWLTSRLGDIRAVVGVPALAARAAHPVGLVPAAFTRRALAETTAEIARRIGVPAVMCSEADAAHDLQSVISDTGAAQLVHAYAPVGPVADTLDALCVVIDAPRCPVRRPWDEMAWPHARAGFFKFKGCIEELIAEFS